MPSGVLVLSSVADGVFKLVLFIIFESVLVLSTSACRSVDEHALARSPATRSLSRCEQVLRPHCPRNANPNDGPMARLAGMQRLPERRRARLGAEPRDALAQPLRGDAAPTLPTQRLPRRWSDGRASPACTRVLAASRKILSTKAKRLLTNRKDNENRCLSMARYAGCI